ncbi:MAG: hypothetical protein QOC54_1809, partial [Baekduia sp.]|nr:hypothetical protein [Baekduia sp.]
DVLFMGDRSFDARAVSPPKWHGNSPSQTVEDR